jgi:transcriptional repressor NrdR
MRCPYCKHEKSKVLDSRDSEDITRRRRKCLKCSKRFTTYERVNGVQMTVVKKDGKREQFSREKLLTGILKACEKRPIGRDIIDNIVDEIDNELRAKKSTEINSKEIGELVMKKLRKLDKVAYIRFASVYREFTDLTSFEDELRKLIRKKRALKR